MDKSTSDVRLARWLPIIEECAASGMPKKDWCKEHNIELKKFYYWQRKRDQHYQPSQRRYPLYRRLLHLNLLSFRFWQITQQLYLFHLLQI